MTGLVVLGAALIALTAFALWADATGFDPFADLYGSDYTAPWSDREPGDLDVWGRELMFEEER